MVLENQNKTMKQFMEASHRRRRRTILSTIPPPVLPPPADECKDSLLINPSSWTINLLAFQTDVITNFLVFITSPFFSLASEYFHHSEETVEKTVVAAGKVPSRVAHGGAVFLRKVAFGCLGAFYACIILISILILSVIVGVGLVRIWVEEPVCIREPLHFDYTEIHPTAVYPLQGNKWGVPVGHTFSVSLVLLMPESDFNRHIGIFQLTAEIISITGNIQAISSHPCMLRFRSLPIRLMHTFILTVPLLLGISDETQKVAITMLKHKEGNPRTGTIRVTLQPRAGTSGLPQLYSADIIINSQLPLMKQLVYNWKWTFYVWASMYVYTMLLVMVVWCCKSLFFPTAVGVGVPRDLVVEEVRDSESRVTGDGDALESLERWRSGRIRRRSKRKAPFLYEAYQEVVGSPASVTPSGEEASEVVEDDFGGFTDAESVCQGG